MGRRKKWSKAVQVRFGAKIHVSMCRSPYIGKCCSELSRAVGKDRDATWPRGAYQTSYLSLYVRQRYIYVKMSFLKRFRRLTYPITLKRRNVRLAIQQVVLLSMDSVIRVP